MKALVTGATGLVGRHLTEKLIARKDQVRALIRAISKKGHLQNLGVELVFGDLNDLRALREAAQGADVIFHCAAKVSLQGDHKEIFTTNIEGTKNMLDAAVAAGVQRFVFVSSVAVYGDSNSKLISEDHPQVPNGPYSASKIEGEKLVLKYHREYDLKFSIVRPCVIYGPGDNNFLLRLVEALCRSRLPLVNGGKSLLDLVYVTDVADALILAATKDEAIGQAYNITDGQKTSIRELIETVAQMLGVKPRLINLPYAIAYGAAWAINAASKILKPPAGGSARLINPATIRASAKDHHYDISKARKELGYEPKVDLKQGLQKALTRFDGSISARL